MINLGSHFPWLLQLAQHFSAVNEPEHRKIVSEAAMKASIAHVDACVADIDEDLLADAALPVPDHMPEENHFWYDKEHPVIEEGSLFRSMKEFRMLMRTFAIRGKFDKIGRAHV